MDLVSRHSNGRQKGLGTYLLNKLCSVKIKNYNATLVHLFLSTFVILHMHPLDC